MKTLTYAYFFLIGLILPNFLFSQKLVNLEWQYTTGNLDPYIQWNSSAIASNGDLASQGIGSGYDYVTLKYEANGTQIWDQRYDRNGYDDIAVKILDNPDLGIDITGGREIFIWRT